MHNTTKHITPLSNYDVPTGWPMKPYKRPYGGTPGPPVMYEKPSDPEDEGAGYGYSNAEGLEENDIYFYHSDHLGSTNYITDKDGNATQFVCYKPYGEALVDEHNTSYEQPWKFNGKELDAETGLYYYGARYYDSRLSMWYGVDALAEKYPNMSPYNYCVGNPVKFVDPDGTKPRIYVEVQGVGHVFVTTGNGNNITVYTYGRYAELGKDKTSARSTSPTGEGVLIVLKGNEAKQFVLNQITEKNAAAFEFMDASDSKVDEFYMAKFNSSDKIPTVGKYKDNDNARVVDEYNLINNNCATTSVQSILYGDGDVSSVIGDNIPFMVAKDLHEEVARERNPINRILGYLLGDNEPHVRLVPTDEILKETKNE